jgi:hypothetical protein
LKNKFGKKINNVQKLK